MAQSTTPSEPAGNANRGGVVTTPRPDERPEGWFSRALRILFGWKPPSARADLQLVLTAEQPESGFSPVEAALLKNILGLRERRIERVMLPRADIIAVQQNIPLGELVKVFENAGHSRLVVFNDTLDDPAGMVHIRDLIAYIAAHAAARPADSGGHGPPPQVDLNLANIDLSMPLAEARIVREILYAPPSMPALDLLAKMQATRIHLALVIDEYGGTDGLVSMEDLVELIIGDVADEHDEAEMPAVTRQNDGSYLATGRASLEDVRGAIGDEFDVGEAEREVDTLGGYLVIRAGHVPVRGELVPGPGPFEAEVLDADPRRIKRIKIYRRAERRPGAGRDSQGSLRASVSRPASREDANRPNPNAPPTP